MSRLPNAFLVAAMLAAGGCVGARIERDPGLAAEAKAVGFLKREVPAWSRDNGCFSCHNNGDAARALYAAKQKGHRIPSRSLADTTAWTVQPGRWDKNKGDPGFSDQRLADIQFASALLSAMKAGEVTDQQPLLDAARKISATQNADGSWPIDTANPVGSPATYGAALATAVALRTLAAAATPETATAVAKGQEWLRWQRPSNTPAAAALILADVDAAGTATLRAACRVFLHRAQSSDGGWGPYADSPPEVFDTALALLALAQPVREPDAAEMIRRGRAFLVAAQLSDGSWPATTRPSGGRSYAQRMSTTGWATLALLATRQ